MTDTEKSVPFRRYLKYLHKDIQRGEKTLFDVCGILSKYGIFVSKKGLGCYLFSTDIKGSALKRMGKAALRKGKYVSLDSLVRANGIRPLNQVPFFSITIKKRQVTYEETIKDVYFHNEGEKYEYYYSNLIPGQKDGMHLKKQSKIRDCYNGVIENATVENILNEI